MNIHEQVQNILADLGVEMEHPEYAYDNDDCVPEVSIFQASRDHYGVFYRLDIINSVPQLRVMAPVEQGALKMEMYLVRMSEQAPVNTLFAQLGDYRGSTAFEQGREAALQHLLYTIAEILKQLFWSGDLNDMSFPPEIEVRRLI